MSESLLDYICEICQEINQLTPLSDIQCRFCGGRILLKPRLTKGWVKPIQIFPCNPRPSPLDEDLTEDLAIRIPLEQKLMNELVKIFRFKEQLIGDLISKTKKSKSEEFKDYLEEKFSDWYLKSYIKGQLDENFFPTENIVIQSDIENFIDDKVIANLHISIPEGLNAPLLDFRNTQNVNLINGISNDIVKTKKIKLDDHLHKKLLGIYSGHSDKLNLNIFYVLNLYSIIGYPLLTLPENVWNFVKRIDGFKMHKELAVSPINRELEAITFFPFENELWKSESIISKYKLSNGILYLSIILQNHLGEIIFDSIINQLSKKTAEVILILPSNISYYKKIKDSKYFKESISVDKQFINTLTSQKSKKYSVLIILLANTDKPIVKLSEINKIWK